MFGIKKISKKITELNKEIHNLKFEIYKIKNKRAYNNGDVVRVRRFQSESSIDCVVLNHKFKDNNISFSYFSSEYIVAHKSNLNKTITIQPIEIIGLSKEKMIIK